MRRNNLKGLKYPLHLSFLKKLFFLSAILFFPAVASAQTEDEMKMLRMYFKEDELVVAPTRSLKPISQVAENMSIVTADEIQAMNAHTLLEVLEHVPGIYINYAANDFFKNGSLFIQPASSAWGSSLGGVINIVTKDIGDTLTPSGMVSASYGERQSQDYNAELSGKAGIVGYYLYAGRQDSDGLRYNRFFERDSLYGKIDVQFHQDVRFMLTAGYNDERHNEGDSSDDDTHGPTTDRASFTTGTLFASITDNLAIEASLYEFRQKFVLDLETLSTGELLYEANLTENKKGGSVKLVYINHMHNAVLGWDVSHGELDQTDDYPGLGTFKSQPGISKWALFVNDTLSIGKLAVTPGLRYDENNISGDFTSPSLGATYKLGKKTILRASVAKGFNIPPLSYTSGASLGYEPNPSLKPETVWSYQTGAESLIGDYLNSRIVFFQHNVKDEMQLETDETTQISHHVNTGKTRRTGMELDMETIPFYNLSLKAGFSYLQRKLLSDDSDNPVNTIYDYNIAVKYDDMKSLSAQLSGNYTWWDVTEDAEFYDPAYKTMIWDLDLVQKIFSTDRFSSKIFLTAHNLFNGSYYTWDISKNPRRWVEAGVRLEF
ncbi:MAG: TonB-dependent receptor [Nitrospirae bacterium]|nr:TonB-dependent receptor [Nitrospirota bacterium]